MAQELIKVKRPLTDKEIDMLWNIKSVAFDFYGSKFTVEAQRFAETIQQAVDGFLTSYGLDPTFHFKSKE